MRSARIIIPIVVAVFLGACGLLTEPGDRYIGAIYYDYPGEALSIVEAPDTVARGETFDVIVRTWVLGGCRSADGGEVVQNRLKVTIVPYDRYVEGLCVGGQYQKPRTFRLSFDDVGEALIRVTGRIAGTDVDADLSDDDAITSIEQRIIVR